MLGPNLLGPKHNKFDKISSLNFLSLIKTFNYSINCFKNDLTSYLS